MQFVRMLDEEIPRFHFHVHLHLLSSDSTLVAPALSGRVSNSDRHYATITPTEINIVATPSTVASAHHVVGRHHRGPEARQRDRNGLARGGEGGNGLCHRWAAEGVLQP